MKTVVTGFLFVALGMGCVAAPKTLATPLLAQVTVIDGLGRSVAVDHSPQRIVSLTPSVTELLYSLGLENRVVGVTSNDTYPPRARLKPVVGDMNPNFEKILSLKPDLVVMEGRLATETLKRLESLGLHVLALDSGSLQGFRLSLFTVARVTGTIPRATELVHSLDLRLKKVQAAVQLVPPDQRPTVFVEVGEKPLFTAGGGTFVDEVVALAGGRNVFDSARSSYPQVSPEAVLLRNPQVVLLTTATAESFSQRSGFQGLKAVRDGRVHVVDPPDVLVRPTMRVGECVERLYALFYPTPKARK